jgi:hypothetical protein
MSHTITLILLLYLLFNIYCGSHVMAAVNGMPHRLDAMSMKSKWSVRRLKLTLYILLYLFGPFFILLCLYADMKYKNK